MAWGFAFFSWPDLTGPLSSYLVMAGLASGVHPASVSEP
jgi:hypothetical protein